MRHIDPTVRVVAPGRVNLIGEHVDYVGLPVLPMAIDRAITLLVRPRPDNRVRLTSRADAREFEISAAIEPYPAGDWGNYAKAALQGLAASGARCRGFDATIESNLPRAAGLSSSSALVVACGLAGLAAGGAVPDDAHATIALSELFAAAESYVGARGGGMDQAAILCGLEDHAVHLQFSPLRVDPIPVPADWRFIVADSGERAEKSSGARSAYNARRASVEDALRQVAPTATSYAHLLREQRADELLLHAAERLGPTLYARFRHVVTEAERMHAATAALAAAELEAFGKLMYESHESLRSDYEVSTEALDRLVDACKSAGAAGARLTGAGFGGCVVALALAPEADRIVARLGPDRAFVVRPSAGAHVEAASRRPIV